jgi:hypothetical protein
MRLCAQQKARDQLDRWLVEGFWHPSEFVPAQVSHPTITLPGLFTPWPGL